MPVECGSGGSGGATGGGKCGGSSLLPRRGLGLATSRGCPGPRCRERVSAPEHEQDSASDGAEIPLPDSSAHARIPEVARGQRRTGHKHSSHFPCIVPLSPACWGVGVGLGGGGTGVLTDPRVPGLHHSASAKPGFLPPGAGFRPPLLESPASWNLWVFLR